MNILKQPFQRKHGLEQLAKVLHWDVIIIGGGATGLGIAVDAANRGLRTLLLEAADFAKGTSSRSTKLVHGGVRYLAQGNISLVFEALRERGYLLRNAAHLVKKQAFIIPCYSLPSLLKYWIGLKIYDWLSGRRSFGASQRMSEQEVRTALPNVRCKHLKGGVRYYDGQFDDARLALNLAQTAAEQGATLLNYMQVTGMVKREGRISGVVAKDGETGLEYNLEATVVINATGIAVDKVLRMDEPSTAALVRPSQGIHLVLPQTFLPGGKALMIPKTTDGRVLFVLPWQGRLLAGTTDTPLSESLAEPMPLEEEVEFVLETMQAYLTKPPQPHDVLSVFAGLRPLAATQNGSEATKEISRSHKLLVAASGLITVTGGKWTTYRQMAEDAVDKAMQQGGFKVKQCGTRRLNIHGCTTTKMEGRLQPYGQDAAAVQALIKEWPNLLMQGYGYTEAEVVWAVKEEMACTVEDVLARRLRLLFLDARAAMQAAPRVAQLVAFLRNKDEVWEKEQVQQFQQLAARYLPNESPLTLAQLSL